MKRGIGRSNSVKSLFAGIFVSVRLLSAAAVAQSCQETTATGYIKAGESYSLAIVRSRSASGANEENWGWTIQPGRWAFRSIGRG